MTDLDNQKARRVLARCEVSHMKPITPGEIVEYDDHIVYQQDFTDLIGWPGRLSFNVDWFENDHMTLKERRQWFCNVFAAQMDEVVWLAYKAGRRAVQKPIREALGL